MKEWSEKNVLNSFNSLKSLCWRESFEQIVQGKIPKPVSVSIDACNTCTLSCSFCHYKDFREENPESVSREDLLWIAKAVAMLDAESLCFSGGGEPFMHPSAGEFIRTAKGYGLQVGSITNGVLLDKFYDDILYSLRWIGVSIDASNAKTYEKLKGGSAKDFNRVIDNIKFFAEARKDKRSPSLGFKFLIHPWNYGELFDAAQLAHGLGVDTFHARPCYLPNLKWETNMINSALEQVQRAQDAFDSDSFHVYGVTHKFDESFKKKLMAKCEVTPIAGLTFAADGWVYLCCDLRGIEQGRLCHWREILDVWGSEKHKQVLANIKPMLCPRRCTYSPYQEILERVFKKDEMCYKFP